jgi:hypothetical protein
MAGARDVVVQHNGTPVVKDLDAGQQADFDANLAAAPGVEAAQQGQRANALTLRQRAQQALQANATFLALPAAQQQVQAPLQMIRLTQQSSALIRLVLGQLDSTAGT